MKRGYVKEPGTVYGRPKQEIKNQAPAWFNTHDEEMKGWDARRFMRELQIRSGDEYWKREKRKWKGIIAGGKPMTDPDEINRFLCRPPSVSQVKTSDDAAHALKRRPKVKKLETNTDCRLRDQGGDPLSPLTLPEFPSLKLKNGVSTE
jgi:hypothetical protein